MKYLSRLNYDIVLDNLLLETKNNKVTKTLLSKVISVLRSVYANNIDFLPYIDFNIETNKFEFLWEKNNRRLIIEITDKFITYLLEDNDELISPRDITDEIGIIKYNLETKLEYLVYWLLTGISKKDAYNYSYKCNKIEKENIIHASPE